MVLMEPASGPALENSKQSAGPKHKPPNELLYRHRHVRERKQYQVTVRVDGNKKATIRFGQYALSLADCPGVFKYLLVEEPLEQMAACSRCLIYHILKSSADAV